MKNTINKTMVNYTEDGQRVEESRADAYQAFEQDSKAAAVARTRRQLAAECFHLKMAEVKLDHQIGSREPNQHWFDWIRTGLKSFVTGFRKN